MLFYPEDTGSFWLIVVNDCWSSCFWSTLSTMVLDLGPTHAVPTSTGKPTWRLAGPKDPKAKPNKLASSRPRNTRQAPKNWTPPAENTAMKEPLTAEKQEGTNTPGTLRDTSPKNPLGELLQTPSLRSVPVYLAKLNTKLMSVSKKEHHQKSRVPSYLGLACRLLVVFFSSTLLHAHGPNTLHDRSIV
jgi:hypothetical protein